MCSSDLEIEFAINAAFHILKDKFFTNFEKFFIRLIVSFMIFIFFEFFSILIKLETGFLII